MKNKGLSVGRKVRRAPPMALCGGRRFVHARKNKVFRHGKLKISGQLIGLTSQTTVLAFQIGATIPNYILPTGGATMAVLGLAKCPLDRWMRFGIKLTAWLYLVCWVFIAIAVNIGY